MKPEKPKITVNLQKRFVFVDIPQNCKCQVKVYNNHVVPLTKGFQEIQVTELEGKKGFSFDSIKMINSPLPGDEVSLEVAAENTDGMSEETAKAKFVFTPNGGKDDSKGVSRHYKKWLLPIVIVLAVLVIVLFGLLVNSARKNGKVGDIPLIGSTTNINAHMLTNFAVNITNIYGVTVTNTNTVQLTNITSLTEYIPVEQLVRRTEAPTVPQTNIVIQIEGDNNVVNFGSQHVPEQHAVPTHHDGRKNTPRPNYRPKSEPTITKHSQTYTIPDHITGPCATVTLMPDQTATFYLRDGYTFTAEVTCKESDLVIRGVDRNGRDFELKITEPFDDLDLERVSFYSRSDRPLKLTIWPRRQ